MSEADDRTIWRYAGAHGYTLVSLDADFAEMAAVLGFPPKVIWLRCGNLPTSAVASLLRANAGTIAHSRTMKRRAWNCIENASVLLHEQ